jgi:acyl-CoA thioester hydrolase
MRYLHRPTFDEMDYAQISFFARHFYWLEHATTAWLVEKGIGFAVLSGERGFGLAIVNAQCRYLAPVHLEQVVEIRLALRDLSRRGFTTPFEIVRQVDGVLCAYGNVSRRVIDVKRVRGADLPDDLYEKLEEMRAESEQIVLHQD